MTATIITSLAGVNLAHRYHRLLAHFGLHIIKDKKQAERSPNEER